MLYGNIEDSSDNEVEADSEFDGGEEVNYSTYQDFVSKMPGMMVPL